MPVPPSKIKRMRDAYLKDKVTQEQLAKQHRKSKSQVSRILRGEHYREGYEPHDFSKRSGHPGEDNPAHKVTWEIVDEIRDRYANEDISQRALAAEYNLSQNQISFIVRFINWKPEDRPALAAK